VKTLRLCTALGLAATANILNLIATELFKKPTPKKKAAVTLPEESGWRALLK